MKEATGILERYYKSFIDQQNAWNFFRGLSDYADYIDKTPEFRPIIISLIKKREADFKIYDNIKQDSLGELNKSRKRLLGVIKSNKIKTTDELAEGLRKLKSFDEGNYSAGSKPVTLNSILLDIARALSSAGHLKLLKPFIDYTQNPQGVFLFSKKIADLYNAKECLDRKKETELWSDWDKLCSVFFHINEGAKKSYLEKLDKENNSYSMDHFLFWQREENMNRIRDNMPPDWTNHFFKIEDFRILSNRIHNYILRELSKKGEERNTKLSSYFDENSGILRIGNEISIKFTKFQDKYNVLRIIFGKGEDTGKEWFYDEIVEKAGGNYDEKKFYNASYQIGIRVASESNIKDYLYTTTHSVKINPKYL